MITGHGGVAGILLDRRRQRTSAVFCIALLAASVAPDILDVIYVIVGVCSPYGLYSHTVYIVAVQAAVIGALAFLATDSRSVGLTFAAVVLLHLPGDMITGNKLFIPGGEFFGLHLYARPLLDWIVEMPLALLGWWLLRRRHNVPRWATSLAAAAFLVAVQTTFDVYAFTHASGIKPNACIRASAPEPVAGNPALVVGR